MSGTAIKLFLRTRFEASVRIMKSLYWSILNLGYRWSLFSVYDIPIVVNNFNRITYPLQLINFLEKNGFNNIIILDNNSTYPPLLSYYETCPHRVVRERQNYGHLALWKSKLFRKIKWNYFVYTDSDVVPIEQCPEDFIQYFHQVLCKNYSLDKVGFGIKIDDLPDTFALKSKVIEYESRYWLREVTPGVYDAPIDTTFALYKPLSSLKLGEAYTLRAFRFGFPYLIHHNPWYIDSMNLSEEEMYYIQTCNNSSSLGMQIKGKGNVY